MPPESIVIDADAFLAIRTLSLLDVIAASPAMRGVLVMTEVVARHDLSPLGSLIRQAEAAGWLVVRAVRRRTPEDAVYRRLKRAGVHKGEAEAIAWSASRASESRPVLVSNDRDARKTATDERVRSGDVMDLVVLLVEAGVVPRAVAREKLGPWVDPEQQLGRPKDLTPFDFERAYGLRRGRWTTR
jgi:predicted nucleic acid-binding protein